MKRKLKFVSVMIGVAAFISLHLVRHEWKLHAKFDLLLHGCWDCQLVIPDLTDTNTVNSLPTGIMLSALVYRNGRYYGIVDRYGNFIPVHQLSSQQLVQQQILQFQTEREALLFWAYWLVLILTCLLVINLILCSRRARDGSGAKG